MKDVSDSGIKVPPSIINIQRVHRDAQNNFIARRLYVRGMMLQSSSSNLVEQQINAEPTFNTILGPRHEPYRPPT